MIVYQRLKDLNYIGSCSGTYGMGDLSAVQPLLVSINLFFGAWSKSATGRVVQREIFQSRTSKNDRDGMRCETHGTGARH